jgi:hypothetical protein
VRIGATTTNNSFDPLAFINPNGKHTVVVKADGRGSFAVQGLEPGSYEVTYTTAGNADVRVGLFTIGPSAALQLTMPDRGVLTIFGT